MFVVLLGLGGCIDMNKKILVETEYNIQESVELNETELVAKLKVNGNESEMSMSQSIKDWQNP